MENNNFPQTAEAVALRLATTIAQAEGKLGEKREYWLKLYAECLAVVRRVAPSA